MEADTAEIFCSFVGVTLGGMTAFIVCFVNNTLTSTKILSFDHFMWV